MFQNPGQGGVDVRQTPTAMFLYPNGVVTPDTKSILAEMNTDIQWSYAHPEVTEPK